MGIAYKGGTSATSQPTPPTQQHKATTPASRPPPAGRGLPPADPNIEVGDGGSAREVRDAAYWDAHPLRAGTHHLRLYVNKIVAWAEVVAVMWRASDWDRTADSHSGKGRPGPHHDREVRWEQGKPDDFMVRVLSNEEKANRGYKMFRRDLVAAYTSAGRPEETWPRDEAGNAWPPWHEFFVQRGGDGICVPLLFDAMIIVEPKRERFPALRSLVPTVVRGSRVQAPTPFEVIPYVAEHLGWRCGEKRYIAVGARDGRPGYETAVVRVDRECVPWGHLGMPTVRDL